MGKTDNDLNEVALRGTVQNIRIQSGWRTVQLATNAGGVRSFNENRGMTPIIYIFDKLECPAFGYGSHIELKGHIQPLRTSRGQRVYEEIIAADSVSVTARDLAYVFRDLRNKPDFDVHNGGFPDDVNMSTFVGTFMSYKGVGKKDPRNSLSMRLKMETKDILSGEMRENVCSIICYERQAAYIVDNAKEGCRIAVSGRTRTLHRGNTVIQQQMAKDVYIL